MYNFNSLPENKKGLLRFWCQTVLPLAYDDSLSYYEVLCKITSYVNKLIEDVKTVETTVENLETKVETVETAVENLESESERFVKSIYESYESAERVDLNNIENPSIISVKPSNTDNLPVDDDILRYTGAMLTHNFEKNGNKHVVQLYMMSSTEPKIFVRYKNFGEGAEAVGNWTEWFLINSGGSTELANYLFNDKEMHMIDADNLTDNFQLYAIIPAMCDNIPEEVKTRNNYTLLFYTPFTGRTETGNYNLAMETLIEADESTRIYTRVKSSTGWGNWETMQGDFLSPPSNWEYGYFLETDQNRGTTNTRYRTKDVFIAHNTQYSNLNNNLQNGIYYIREISSYINKPENLSGEWRLAVVGLEGHTKQILFSNNDVYSREMVNDNWSGWVHNKLISVTTAGGEIFNNSSNASLHAHAEGDSTGAWGNYSHSEGLNTGANGVASHAEGNTNYSNGANSHTEGLYNQSNGDSSHSEGQYCSANGVASHAEGYHATAIGDYSHASGYYTSAVADNQFVCGAYNKNDTEKEYAFIVGNGDNRTRTKNAFGVKWNGDITGKGINNFEEISSGSATISGLTATISATVNLSKYRAFALSLHFIRGAYELETTLLALKMSASPSFNKIINFIDNTSSTVYTSLSGIVSNEGVTLYFDAKGVMASQLFQAPTVINIGELTFVGYKLYGIE